MLKMKLTGAGEYRRSLQRAEEVVSDMSETFDHVFHPFMLRHMRRQFETSGRYGGAPWAGYDQEPIYAAVKRRRVGHLHVLRGKPGQEKLYPSLTTQGGAHLWQRSADAASFGTRLPFAQGLERGGVGPYGERFPARLIVRLPPRVQRALEQLLKADLLARIEGRSRPSLGGV